MLNYCLTSTSGSCIVLCENNWQTLIHIQNFQNNSAATFPSLSRWDVLNLSVLASLSPQAPIACSITRVIPAQNIMMRDIQPLKDKTHLVEPLPPQWQSPAHSWSPLMSGSSHIQLSHSFPSQNCDPHYWVE